MAFYKKLINTFNLRKRENKVKNKYNTKWSIIFIQCDVIEVSIFGSILRTAFGDSASRFLYKVLHRSVQYFSFPTGKATRRHFWLLSLSGYRAIVINKNCLSTFYRMTSAILEFALKNASHVAISRTSIINSQVCFQTI